MKLASVVAAAVGAVGISLVPATQAVAGTGGVTVPPEIPSIPWGIAYDNNGVDSTGHHVADDIATTVANDGGVVPPLVDVFNNMLEGSKGQYDATFPTPQVQAVVKAGSIPMITTQWPGTLRQIVLGKDDAMIAAWAEQAAAFGHTLLFRPWRELNGKWYPWGVPNVGATRYVKAWRHAYNIVHPIAPNVLWVWNTNTSGTDDYEAAYPGDAYVSYVSFDSYVGNSKKSWWSVTDWTRTQSMYRTLAGLGSGTKPMIVPEFSMYTNAKYATQSNRATWITDTFADAASNQKRVVSMDWFNGGGTVAAFDAPGWKQSKDAFDEAINNPPYG